MLGKAIVVRLFGDRMVEVQFLNGCYSCKTWFVRMGEGLEWFSGDLIF